MSTPSIPSTPSTPPCATGGLSTRVNVAEQVQPCSISAVKLDEDTPCELDPRQLQAIELLARGLHAEVVATKVGVTSRTLRRWKKEPQFAAELHDHVVDFRDNVLFNIHPVIRRMQHQADEALTRNRELLQSENSIVATRACGRASDNAIKWIKLFMQLERAETARQVAAATASMSRAAAAQSSAAPRENAIPAAQAAAPVSPSPSTEGGPGGEVTPAASAASASVQPPESGQKRTSQADPTPAQPQAGEKVSASFRTKKAMSAPDTGADIHPVIAAAAAAVVAQRRQAQV